MLILKHWSERQQPAGILSGNRGRWVPSSCPPCLLKAGRCHFTFSFSFFWWVLPLHSPSASFQPVVLSSHSPSTVCSRAPVSPREKLLHKPGSPDFIFRDQVIAAAIHNILRFPGSGGQGDLWSRSHGTIITRQTVLGNYLSRARQKIANWYTVHSSWEKRPVCLSSSLAWGAGSCLAHLQGPTEAFSWNTGWRVQPFTLPLPCSSSPVSSEESLCPCLVPWILWLLTRAPLTCWALVYQWTSHS